MKTTDIVIERALALAAEVQDEDEAVRELRAAALGKRVALVMARQRINEQAAVVGPERAARAVSLLDATIATGDFTD